MAIVSRRIAAAVIDGRKRIESRLALTRRAPFGRIRRGDRIYFKISGAEIVGSCTCRRVLQFDRLSPAGVCELRRRFGPLIAADRGYWSDRRAARYATLAWLGQFQPVGAHSPNVERQFGSGWIVLG
ncbi:MAG: hypothetical protein JNG88_12765 [Phycisphaerales bacterium]|nr:hypothetical protein [Phycisphaerales bacterium]